MSGKVSVVLIVASQIIITLQIQFTSNSFGNCLKQEKPNIITCVGKQAIETLQQLNNVDNFTLTPGVVFSKDESVMGRSAPINFLDNDPNDFR